MIYTINRPEPTEALVWPFTDKDFINPIDNVRAAPLTVAEYNAMPIELPYTLAEYQALTETFPYTLTEYSAL